MGVHILEGPVTDGEPVQGVCEGRMVAYWPSEYDEAQGLKAPGHGGYIPAVITATWANGQAVAMPCANISLFTDLNVPRDVETRLGSRLYSSVPARGCWTWIPKA